MPIVAGQEGGGGLRTWNFQGYLKNRMWKSYSGQLEYKRSGISRAVQENHVQRFPWVLVFDLGFSGFIT